MEIDSFFRSSKHTKESSASRTRSTTSVSNKAQASVTNTHHEQTAGKSSLDDFQVGKSASSAKSDPTLSNPIHITAREDVHSQDDNTQKYAASVMNGMSSLGIDIMPYLQQSLIDQHGHSVTGHYPYSTVVGGMEFSAESQHLDFGLTPQQDDLCLAYVDNDGYSNEDLAGIGAQFQG